MYNQNFKADIVENGQLSLSETQQKRIRYFQKKYNLVVEKEAEEKIDQKVEKKSMDEAVILSENKLNIARTEDSFIDCGENDLFEYCEIKEFSDKEIADFGIKTNTDVILSSSGIVDVCEVKSELELKDESVLDQQSQSNQLSRKEKQKLKKKINKKKKKAKAKETETETQCTETSKQQIQITSTNPSLQISESTKTTTTKTTTLTATAKTTTITTKPAQMTTNTSASQFTTTATNSSDVQTTTLSKKQKKKLRQKEKEKLKNEEVTVACIEESLPIVVENKENPVEMLAKAEIEGLNPAPETVKVTETQSIRDQ